MRGLLFSISFSCGSFIRVFPSPRFDISAYDKCKYCDAERTAH